MSRPLQLELSVEARLLVLIGGGEFSFGETRAIDEFLLAQMPADRRAIAFLPTASGSAEYATHIGRHFKSIDPTVDTINVPIYRGRDSRRQKNLDLILSAGMVYLGGGVTNQVADTLVESAADLAMRGAAAKGTVIAGIGSAASAFGSHMRDMRGGGSLPGLNWLTHVVVDTAFDPADDVALRRLMSIPDVEMGIGLPTGTALAVRAGGATEIIGSGNIAVFRKA